MAELSIKVTIAGRIYPLTVKREEEEMVRKAAKFINDRMKDYEENYAVRDKQDLLAMCGLQLSTHNLQMEDKALSEDKVIINKLNEMDALVSDYLQKEDVFS